MPSGTAFIRLILNKELTMKNQIGDSESIHGNSMALNGQAGQGGVKPSAKGSDSPGGTKPKLEKEEHVPMPK
jgi:hypothetical protein